MLNNLKISFCSIELCIIFYIKTHTDKYIDYLAVWDYRTLKQCNIVILTYIVWCGNNLVNNYGPFCLNRPKAVWSCMGSVVFQFVAIQLSFYIKRKYWHYLYCFLLCVQEYCGDARKTPNTERPIEKYALELPSVVRIYKHFFVLSTPEAF